MRGTSRASLAELERGWEPVLTRAKGKALVLGTELFAVVDALDANPSVLRAVADPAASVPAKSALVSGAFAAADKRVIALLDQAATLRWSADRDLSDSLERLGRIAVLAAAATAGELDEVSEEVFQLSRALNGQRELRAALTDPAAPAVGRVELVTNILAGRSTAATAALVRRIAGAPRGIRFVPALGHLSDLIAERQSLQIANVTTAAPLTTAQTDRLKNILGRVLGREVKLNVTVDSRVVGGLKVQSGPDVVDATVLARLAEARRQLVS